MSIINFSNKLWYMSIPDSSTSIDLGSFTTDSEGTQQLKHVKVLFYLSGDFDLDSIVLSVTDSLSAPTLTYTSDIIRIKKDVSQDFANNASWLGWLRFDFAEQWLDASTTYYLYIDASNYDGISTDIGLVFDYPIPVNGTRLGAVEQHPIAFQIFGLKED
jgi:hypothetical protein